MWGAYTRAKTNHRCSSSTRKDLEMYRYVKGEFFKGDTSIVNEKYFTEDVTVVTPEGDLVGIEAVKNHYLNFFIGFSDVEFTIVDAFGQGIKLKIF